jgi:hypothetical protein
MPNLVQISLQIVHYVAQIPLLIFTKGLSIRSLPQYDLNILLIIY